ncbi:CRISPR-associated helicase Cas3' [Arhodomonas sp. SL1]|uniref:CRISPR-associated helicase Cas3' n=1 Tax=Arhodomonas sp. SL1 TaxID=3425691 RepID=UPI003F880E39
MVEGGEVYWPYWGKAKAGRDHQSVPCHLLAYHCLDVAAVGWVFLELCPSLAGRIATTLELDVPSFRALFTYSLALHDIGKFSRTFQGLTQPAESGLVPPIPGMSYVERHDALGALAWFEDLVVRLPGRPAAETPEWLDLEVEEALGLWMGCFFGHHGKPVDGGRARMEARFTKEDRAALRAFAEDVAELLPPSWPLERLADERWRTRVLPPATWQVAGLATLADWLGSNAHYFRYVTEPQPLEDYWQKHALPRAREVLTSSGLVDQARAAGFPGFETQFGFSPSPLQDWASSVDLKDEPQLFLLEDTTGSGKTEAALTLTHRMLEAGLADGVYFGLPTMATSNAMYRRMGQHYRRFFRTEDQPSLVLSHGARQLNDTFQASIVPEPNVDRPYGAGEDSAGAACRSWFADTRKKALLAEVGVGTIDQALLGVLPRRHQSLRLLGLARKVLVVDEVHAYDTYTRTLLARLLEGHARQGGCAILLSATMPAVLRRELLQAWRRGREGTTSAEPIAEAFPLASHMGDGEPVEEPVATRSGCARRLPVEFVYDPESAMDIVVAAAQAGQCACWIRNTVDDAVAAYQQLRERLEAADCALLFHARFTMGDRQRIESDALDRFGEGATGELRRGRILVATQVVEQSLDLDFDVLVTDLAPIDLIVQRAGRLHRHARDVAGNRKPLGEPDERPVPVLHVLAPEWTDDPPADWVRSTLRGTSYVYPDPAQLWHTARVLRQEGAIELPERARPLLEAVYGEDVPVPEGLLHGHYEHYAGQRTAASGARFNALRLESGYRITGDGAGWDDDQEIGTRLSEERTVQVLLLQEVDGVLKPWHDGERHPWAMSMVSLREGQAHRLPDLPERLADQADALREAYPGLRFARFWLPLASAEVAGYDPETGVVLP